MSIHDIAIRRLHKYGESHRACREELEDAAARFKRLWVQFDLLAIENDTLLSRIAALEASNYVLASRAGEEVRTPSPASPHRGSTEGGTSGFGADAGDEGGSSSSALLSFPAQN